MPIRYSVDKLHGRLLTHAVGNITADDINAHLDLEQRDRNLEVPELVDARGATADVTTDQIRRLVQRATNMLRHVKLGPTAIVTDNDVVFGMARMYSLLVDGAGVRVEVFRDLEAARQWLDQAATARK
jgi:hypothetical protein